VPSLDPTNTLNDGVWLVEVDGTWEGSIIYSERCAYHPDSYEYSEATHYADWPPVSPSEPIHESERPLLVLAIVQGKTGASFIDPDTPVWFAGAEWEGVSQPYSAVADQMWDFENAPEANRKNRFLWLFVNGGEITEIVVFHGDRYSIEGFMPEPGPTPSWWDR
jgi:hypothetical protein